MVGLKVDRWLNLTARPAFLRSIDPSEHIWWRPPETFALVVVTVAICGTLSTLVASLLNYWLVHGLLLHQFPTWPRTARPWRWASGCRRSVRPWPVMARCERDAG